MEKLTSFWQQIPQGAQTILVDFFIILFVFILGKLVSYFAREKMKEFELNDYFRNPLDFSKKEDEQEKGASDLFPLFLTGSIWVLGASWIASVHQSKESAEFLLKGLGKLWMVGIVAILAIFCGNLLARGIMGVLRSSFLKEKIDSFTVDQNSRGESFSESLAKAVGTIIFCFVFLLIFLTFMEIFELNAARAAVAEVWKLGIRLLSAGVALGIGWMGIAFVLNYEEPAGSEKSPARSLDHHARIGIVIVTTIFAMDLIASTAGSILWFALLILLGVCLVPLKEHLFDIWAGFSLDFYQVKNVTIDGRPFTIDKVGFLHSTLRDHGGYIQSQPNKMILAAHWKEKSII